MEKKWIVVSLLIGVLFIGGCLGESKTGDSEENKISKVSCELVLKSGDLPENYKTTYAEESGEVLGELYGSRDACIASYHGFIDNDFITIFNFVLVFSDENMSEIMQEIPSHIQSLNPEYGYKEIKDLDIGDENRAYEFMEITDIGNGTVKNKDYEIDFRKDNVFVGLCFSINSKDTLEDHELYELFKDLAKKSEAKIS